MHRKWLFLALTIVLVVGSFPLSAIHAQDSTITLTLAVPSFAKDLYTEELLSKFTEAHPGVSVQVVGVEPDIPPAVQDVGKHLTAAQDYVSKGDVVLVDSSSISQEATRAGLFYDLTPLVNDDKTLNIDDFYPKMWSAFQWDRGIWALPSGGSTLILSYKPAAFDAAGLAYPTDKWTSDDWANAIRKLSQKDASGKVTIPGLGIGGGPDSTALALALIGEPLYDETTVPDTPQLEKPSVEKVLDTWSQLDQDGLIGSDFTTSPIGIAPAMIIAFSPTPADKRVGILMPGGKAGLDVQGYAVSAGTPHADEAYALAAFLTNRPEASGRFAGMSARKSLKQANAVGAFSVAGSSDDSNNAKPIGPAFPPEIQELNDHAVANGLNEADLRYVDYLLVALAKMKSDKMDAHTALQLVQKQAVDDEQAAIAKKGTLTVTLATPVPIVVPEGKITLKFGLTSFMRPVPNEDLWTKLARDFAQNDPQVGKVNIVNGFGDMTQNANQFDCFYLPYNGVPSANLSSLLNLDPYLSADKTFDPADVVGNILPQLQRDGKTWGLPIMIQPEQLKYDASQLSKAGVPAPTNGWTVDTFSDALKALKANGIETPYEPNGPGGTYLLMLMAAYGGLPLDYRTSPPTINFTDPDTVTAIKQVLDLAKSGLIKYEAIGSVGNVVVFKSGGPDKVPPITSQSFGGFGIAIRKGGGGGDVPPDPYTPVNYPTGTKYNAISYGIGTAYISANTQNADACYRWISYLAQHPEVFSSMPARRSLINSSANTPAAAAIYNQFDALITDPKTISFPSMFEGGDVIPTGFILTHWLYEAFDNYVLHDADLNSALKDAENYAKTFQTCANGIAPYDATSGQSAQDYQKAYLDCAAKADSRLQSFVQGIKP